MIEYDNVENDERYAIVSKLDLLKLEKAIEILREANGFYISLDGILCKKAREASILVDELLNEK